MVLAGDGNLPPFFALTWYAPLNLFTAERGFTAAAQNGASPERFAWPARRTTLEGVQVSAMRDARGLAARRDREAALPDQWVYDFFRHQAPGGRGEVMAARA